MVMRWTAALAAIALSAFAPSLAMAGDADVERQLREMQMRMQQMEDKLQATTDQLESANQRVEEQSQLIEKSGLAETRGASSGLPGFLGEITVGGWVAASYFYNVNDPNDDEHFDGLGPDFGEFDEVDTDGDGIPDDVVFDPAGGLGGTNAGANGLFYPFHPDHNSFALDQVWWEIERPISEEHRAGFRLDTVYGKTGALMNGGGPSNRRDGIRDDTSFYLHQGYVQYLAPVGDGITFKMGKFATPIGVEVAQTVYNWNITRGNVYNLLEPIDHIGLQAGYAFGDTGFDIMGGIVNGFFPDDPDRNDAKSGIAHVGWANDMVTVGVNGIYGAEGQGRDGGEGGVINGLVKINPTDRLGFYINGDYRWAASGPDDFEDAQAWGVSAAGRFGITDRTGIALRGEYVSDINRFFFNGNEDEGGTGFDVWGVTATVDHLLTDNLMVRAEARYDNVNKDSQENDEFFEDSAELENDQITVGAEVIYNFNKFGGE
jgi:hypothetical protein